MQIQIVYKDDLSDEIRQLCEKYWLCKPGEDTKFVHNATTIMSESGLEFYNFKETIQESCHIDVEGCHCVDCGANCAVYDRKAFKRLNLESWQCSDCYNKQALKRYEERIVRSQEDERIKKENIRLVTPVLKAKIAEQLNSIPKVDELDIIDKILLVATAKEFTEENFRPSHHFTTYTDSAFEPDFTPTNYLDIQVLEHLLDANVLLFNFDRNLKSMRLGEEGQLILNIAYTGFDFAYDKQTVKQIESDVKQRRCTIKDIDNPKFEEWVKGVQIARFVASLKHGLPNCGIGYYIGDGVKDLFKNALDTYTVAEMIDIIPIAIRHVCNSGNNKTLTASESDNEICESIAFALNLCRRGKFRNYPTPKVQPETAIEKTLSRYLFARLNMYDYTYPQIAEKIKKRTKKNPPKLRIL